jgi:tRNA 2-thiouridine synthesizing protein A
MAAIIIRDRMQTLLDARGLACPLPAVKARAALAALAPGETLVVLATDPEAPVDIGALAADGGHTFSAERAGREWRLTLVKRGGPGASGG